MSKRIISFMLIVVMLLCIVPISANAETLENGFSIIIKAPESGNKPSYTYDWNGRFDPWVTDEDPATMVNGVEWYDNHYRVIDPDALFELDGRYIVNIFIQAEPGYEFPTSADEIDAYVNGVKVTDFTPYVTNNKCTTLRIGFAFEPAHCWVDNVIEPATNTHEGVMTQRCFGCEEETAIQAIPKLDGAMIDDWHETHGYSYTGKNIKPSVYVCATDEDYNEIPLVEGHDYTLSYPSACKAIGTYTIIVNYMGRYAGTEKIKYKIVLGKPVVISKIGTTAVKLSWNKIVGAKYYRIWSYNSATGKKVLLKKTTARSFTKTGLQPGHVYFFIVRACTTNSSGKEILSPFDIDYDLKDACTLCKAPVAKASVSGKTVTLKWTKCTGASYYKVFKYNAKTKKYTFLKTTKKLTLKLAKQPKGTNYYLVRAYNLHGNGSAVSAKNLAKAVVK